MTKVFIALYVLATSAALILLKLGTETGAPFHFADRRIHLNINFYTVIGIILYGISFLLYMYLLSKYDLGYIIPLATALVYAAIFTASFIIFKETFTVLKIVGILLIVGGAIVLNFNK